MMRSKFIFVMLAWCLFGLVLWLGGCNCNKDTATADACKLKIGDWSQPGETEAEGDRRHIRKLRIDQQNFMRDLDGLLHLDRPSKLTELRAP